MGVAQLPSGRIYSGADASAWFPQAQAMGVRSPKVPPPVLGIGNVNLVFQQSPGLRVAQRQIVVIAEILIAEHGDAPVRQCAGLSAIRHDRVFPRLVKRPPGRAPRKAAIFADGQMRRAVHALKRLPHLMRGQQSAVFPPAHPGKAGIDRPQMGHGIFINDIQRRMPHETVLLFLHREAGKLIDMPVYCITHLGCRQAGLPGNFVRFADCAGWGIALARAAQVWYYKPANDIKRRR